jgi:hypothetical protein
MSCFLLEQIPAAKMACCAGRPWGLFAVEGVGGVGGGSAHGGRGLPMMGVLTPPDRKTSTWMTLLLRTASAARI